MKRIVLSVVAAVAAAVSAWGGTATWQPDGDGNWSGDWTSTAHWSTGAEPTSTDDVVIPAGVTAFTVTAAKAIDVKSLTIGSADGSASANATFESKTSARHRVRGDVTVYAKGVLTHTAAPDAETYKLNMDIDGDMTLAGSVDVSNKGRDNGKGDDPNRQHARHGDLYGNVRLPVAYGSGGTWGTGRQGGGVVSLDIQGALVHTGSILARGTGAGSCDGSGGSVLVKAGSISGSGSVNVTSSRSGASAGRIALYQRASDSWAEFTGAVSYGGGGYGGGTYYRETPATAGFGEVFIGTGSAGCAFSSTATGWTAPFGSVTANSALTVSGTLTTTNRIEVGPSGSITATALVFAPPEGGVHTVSVASGRTLQGTSVSCTAPGATLRFAPGSELKVPAGTVAVPSGLTLKGADGKLLKLESETAESAWTINVGADAAPAIEYVDVSDSHATGVTLSALSSNDGGRNEGWTFPGVIRPGDRIVWTGGVNEEWGEAGNWDRGRTVEPTDVVVISNNTGNVYPVVTMPTTVNALEIDSVASITVQSTTLAVTNWIDCAGEILGSTAGEQGTLRLAEGFSRFEMAGGNARTVRPNVVIDKPAGGEIAFVGGLVADSLACLTTNELALVFESGKAFRFARLQLDGFHTSEGSVGATNLTLRSSAANESWTLDAGLTPEVRGAFVSDSASVKALYVGATCVDCGRNPNWVFDADVSHYWTGKKSTSFRAPENWLPATVPSTNSHVVIAQREGQPATVSLAAGDAVSVASLIVGGLGGAESFTVRSKLRVAGDVEVKAGATLALDYFKDAAGNADPVEVGGDFLLRSGATLTHSVNGNVNATAYRLNLAVAGDMTVEADAAVDVTAKGFGDGYGPGSCGKNTPASHGGLVDMALPSMAYGSIFEPVTLGSGGGGFGGGAVQLVVGGRLQLNDAIRADGGGDGWTRGFSSGGSVCLKAERILGNGSISASSIRAPGGSYGGGAGGRVAIYQMTAKDFAFAGSVTVNGTNGNDAYGKPQSTAGTGTYYRQLADDKEHGGTIYISGNDRTPFPMPDDGDPKTAYKDATLVVNYSTASTGVPINTNKFDVAKTEVRVKDLILQSSKSYLTLNGATVRVIDRTHKDGEGWGGTMETLVKGDGEVVWGLPGFLLFVR